jgi:hypothetical protein
MGPEGGGMAAPPAADRTAPGPLHQPAPHCSAALKPMPPFCLHAGTTLRAACPTGSTVNLATLFATHFSQGLVACPNNSVLCAWSGCSDCDYRYGSCFQGTCQCKVHYFGSNCQTSVANIPSFDPPSMPPPPSPPPAPPPPAPPPKPPPPR